jgi:hypothetical protein
MLKPWRWETTTSITMSLSPRMKPMGAVAPVSTWVSSSLRMHSSQPIDAKRTITLLRIRDYKRPGGQSRSKRTKRL